MADGLFKKLKGLDELNDSNIRETLIHKVLKRGSSGRIQLASAAQKDNEGLNIGWKNMKAYQRQQ